VAAAVAPGATLAGVVEAMLDVAHDGTADALRSVVHAFVGWPGAPTTDDQERALRRRVRDAVAPFDSVGPEYRNMSRDARRPSRTMAIEELPAAVGFLLGHGGDFRGSVLGAVNYGRDADSIAVMAGAVAAGLGGSEVVPTEWLDRIEAASRMDIRETGRLLAGAARDVLVADRRRAGDRARALDVLLGDDVAARGVIT
jgi:hypothetical protein